MQEPRSGKLMFEQRDPFGFGELCIIGSHASADEQLADDHLVDVGILSEVEHGKVKAEDSIARISGTRRPAASGVAPCVAREASMVARSASNSPGVP